MFFLVTFPTKPDDVQRTRVIGMVPLDLPAFAASCTFGRLREQSDTHRASDEPAHRLLVRNPGTSTRRTLTPVSLSSLPPAVHDELQYAARADLALSERPLLLRESLVAERCERLISMAASAGYQHWVCC